MRALIRHPLILVALVLYSALAGRAQPPAPAGRPSEREVADRARTKVVILKTRRANGVASATGFVAAPRVVVTAAHAVEGVTGITAWLNGVSYAADVLETHPEHDLALLSLRAPELYLKPIDLAENATALAPGEPLLILAGPSQPRNARGEPEDRVALPAKFGRRAMLRTPSGGTDTLLSLSASVERGDSGSPVLRLQDGKVVGVLSSRELPAEDGVSRTAYAVPVDALRPWLDHARHAAPDGDFYLFRALGK